MEALLGPQLLSSEGIADSSAALAGKKYVGICASHCRRFRLLASAAPALSLTRALARGRFLGSLVPALPWVHAAAGGVVHGARRLSQHGDCLCLERQQRGRVR